MKKILATLMLSTFVFAGYQDSTFASYQDSTFADESETDLRSQPIFFVVDPIEPYSGLEISGANNELEPEYNQTSLDGVCRLKGYRKTIEGTWDGYNSRNIYYFVNTTEKPRLTAQVGKNGEFLNFVYSYTTIHKLPCVR